MKRAKCLIATILVLALAGISPTVEGQRRQRTPPATNRNTNAVESRLTGVYRLDVASSDNPQTAAERAYSVYAFDVNPNAVEELTTRLTSPDKLSLERRGNVVSIASTRAPRITFEADGRLSSGRGEQR